jgi:hypothetical protein
VISGLQGLLRFAAYNRSRVAAWVGLLLLVQAAAGAIVAFAVDGAPAPVESHWRAFSDERPEETRLEQRAGLAALKAGEKPRSQSGGDVLGLGAGSRRLPAYSTEGATLAVRPTSPHLSGRDTHLRIRVLLI